MNSITKRKAPSAVNTEGQENTNQRFNFKSFALGTASFVRDAVLLSMAYAWLTADWIPVALLPEWLKSGAGL